MRILYLDTSVAKVAKVRIVENESIVSEEVGESPLIVIEKALGKRSLQLSQIDQFDSNPGPGSFTGIRIGAAVTNTLNFALDKEPTSKELIYK